MTGIIILNYNTPKQTIECVNSIIKFEGNSVSIVVVDNCSTDDSYNILKEFCLNFSNVLFVVTQKNGGYSYGNNYGTLYLHTGIEEIVFINSDIVFQNDAITKMKNMLHKEKKNNVAIIGPEIYGNHGQIARRKLRSIDYLLRIRPFCYFHIRTSRNIKFNLQESKVFSGMVSGCCFMIKKSVFDIINGFDENVFLYSEEDIIAYKLDQINYKVAICDEAIVLHKHSESISKKGLAFRRKFSLLSPLYCLKVYEQKSFGLIYLCIFCALIQYSIFSIFNNSYRKELLDFLKRLGCIIKIKEVL